MNRREFFKGALGLGAGITVLALAPQVQAEPETLAIVCKGNVGLSNGGTLAFKLDVSGVDKTVKLIRVD